MLFYPILCPIFLHFVFQLKLKIKHIDQLLVFPVDILFLGSQISSVTSLLLFSALALNDCSQILFLLGSISCNLFFYLTLYPNSKHKKILQQI